MHRLSQTEKKKEERKNPPEEDPEFQIAPMIDILLVLLVFFTLLLGVIDCGQVLFAHQSLVERVRSAVRWGVVHATTHASYFARATSRHAWSRPTHWPPSAIHWF